MDFQIHRYPATDKRIDLVIIANFPQQEADAIEDSNAWDRVCIRSIYVSNAFFESVSKSRITYRHLMTPGVMLENFDPSYADKFQEKFETTYAKEAYNNLLPIITTYRRKMHREHEKQRDEFMNVTAPLQIGHYPQISIISHEQRLLPSR